MFSVRELKNPQNKVTIFISLGPTTIQLTADGDYVRVGKYEQSIGSLGDHYFKHGDLYEVATSSCTELIKNGTIEMERVELDKTGMEPPRELLKLRCKTFNATFVESEVVKKWLKLVEGPLETLNITTEFDKIRGIGDWEQVKSVRQEVVIAKCDITDQELDNLQAKSFAFDSENITENGVRTLMKKWLVTYIPGNAFQIRFKPSPGFIRNELFKDLKDAEVSWNQGFRFDFKYHQPSGSVVSMDGFYFITGEFHLIKVLTPEGWRPHRN